ncbi:MAG: preprotein translocase subunit SecG [Prevotellaceae bacterium]|jgi:preprotein translocase subunit SecG|nr:preprotein translocase subunit SecG [Prevotellaceae bacterium]
MYTTFSIIIVIASILLTLVVLVQNSKGGGLAANFASGNQAFGVRQTADFLEKTTWTLALTILVCCVLATAFISTGKTAKQSELQNRLENVQTGNPTPQFPTMPSAPSEAPIE